VCNRTEMVGEGSVPVVTLPVFSRVKLTLKRVVPGALQELMVQICILRAAVLDRNVPKRTELLLSVCPVPLTVRCLILGNLPVLGRTKLLPCSTRVPK